MNLPHELRDLIDAGPMAHLSTTGSDGAPQVSVIWIGRDGDDILSGHLGRRAKITNIERDPRVALSFDAPPESGVFLTPYAVLHAHASLEHGDAAWDLLDRLAKVYLAPDAPFPAPRAPGFLVRYRVRPDHRRRSLGDLTDQPSQRQNGWPSGSRQTRTSSWGWNSASVAPLDSACSSADARSSTRPPGAAASADRPRPPARQDGRRIPRLTGDADAAGRIPDDHEVRFLVPDPPPEQAFVEAGERGRIG